MLQPVWYMKKLFGLLERPAPHSPWPAHGHFSSPEVRPLREEWIGLCELSMRTSLCLQARASPPLPPRRVPRDRRACL